MPNYLRFNSKPSHEIMLGIREGVGRGGLPDLATIRSHMLRNLYCTQDGNQRPSDTSTSSAMQRGPNLLARHFSDSQLEVSSAFQPA